MGTAGITTKLENNNNQISKNKSIQEPKEKMNNNLNTNQAQNINTEQNTNSNINLGAGNVIEVPNGLGSSHTYMGWQMITSTSSTQYKLKESAGMNFDEEGFGKIGDRYVGSYYNNIW